LLDRKIMPVKSVIHPLTGRRVFFGRKQTPIEIIEAHAKIKDYLPLESLPTAPATIDYSPEAMAALLLIYLNNVLGCCVPAATEHADGVFTGNAGGPAIIFTDTQTEFNYTGMSGGEFNPADPSTDQGCNIDTALTYWQANGLLADGSHKIAGWLAVDPTNVAQVKSTIWLFGDNVLGLNLPAAWITPFPSESGFVWDVAGDPDPNNGHCVVAIGYTAVGIIISTWGMIGIMTWAALAKYCASSVGGELYTVLNPDWANQATQKAPSGTYSLLVGYFNSMGGTVTPPVVVVPPPVPVSPPVVVPPAAPISSTVYITDVNKYVSDVTAAIARSEAAQSALTSELTSAPLTSSQRIALAVANAATRAASLIAKGSKEIIE